jgi:hypothetical protein
LVESIIFAHRFSAITSISTSASFGRSLTATQLLAGLPVKYSAYTSLNAEKSAMSARKHSVLKTFSRELSAAFRTDQLLADTVRLSGDVFAFNNSRFGIQRNLSGGKNEKITACEYGPIAAGALFV